MVLRGLRVSDKGHGGFLIHGCEPRGEAVGVQGAREPSEGCADVQFVGVGV